MKKTILALGTLVATITPVATMVACGTTAKDYKRGDGNDISYIQDGFGKDEKAHKNVMSSYFNDSDMLATLGYYPDFSSKSSDGTVYSDYLKDILGEDNKETGGKYKIKAAPRIMDGKVVDRESILKDNISTLLLNEWEKVDETKFNGITPAIIYTSMADGHARFMDEDYYNGEFEKSWGLNTYEAFEMFAKGLDRSYPGHDFITHAQEIIKSVKANMKLMNDANKSNQKSIIVLEVEKNKDGNIVAKQVRSAGVYSSLYSQNPERGMGFTFPKAKTPGNIKVGDFGLTAVDKQSLDTEFANTSDEVIVLNNPEGNDFNEIQKVSQNAFKNYQKDGDKTKVHVLNRDLFYDTVWGIYGLNKFMGEINTEFNINAELNDIPDFKDTKELEQLR